MSDDKKHPPNALELAERLVLAENRCVVLSDQRAWGSAAWQRNKEELAEARAALVAYDNPPPGVRRARILEKWKNLPAIPSMIAAADIPPPEAQIAKMREDLDDAVEMELEYEPTIWGLEQRIKELEKQLEEARNPKPISALTFTCNACGTTTCGSNYCYPCGQKSSR